MAHESQGSVIYFSTSTSNSTAIIVGEVVGFNGPTGQANTIDVTHLGSTAKEFMMGLADEGEITLDINFKPTDSGQIKLRESRAGRVKSHFAIKLTDTAITMIHGDCYVLGLTAQGSVDNALKGSATLKISGALNYTTVS